MNVVTKRMVIDHWCVRSFCKRRNCEMEGSNLDRLGPPMKPKAKLVALRQEA